MRVVTRVCLHKCCGNSRWAILRITCSACLVGDEVWVILSDVGVNNKFVRTKKSDVYFRSASQTALTFSI
jgi:hypothetical protein